MLFRSREVRDVIDRLEGVSRLVVCLLYGSGLRLQECLNLRVKDLDFELRQLTVRRGTGAGRPGSISTNP